jgi:hypothetical protein
MAAGPRGAAAARHGRGNRRTPACGLTGRAGDSGPSGLALALGPAGSTCGHSWFFSPPLGRFHSSSSHRVRAISVRPRPANSAAIWRINSNSEREKRRPQKGTDSGSSAGFMSLDPFVHPAGKRPTVAPAILLACLAPGRFRIGFGLPAGERRRLPLGGPQGLLQLAAQAFDLLPQARVLLLQAFILFQSRLQLLPQQPVLPLQLLQPPEQVALTRRAHPPLR